jgi:4-hydroxybenzoate polyprenyltransferase
VIIPTALFYYSFKYKYQPVIGNLVVALLAAMVVFIYWLFEFYHLKTQPEQFIEASRSFAQLNRFIMAFALFAFLTTFTREIIKDAQDIEGDKRFGCRTLPIIMHAGSLRLLLIFLEILIIACLAWFHLVLHHSGYDVMSFSLLVPLALLVYAVIKTYGASDKKAFAHLSLIFKLIMLSGMLSLAGTWFRQF